MCHLVVFDEPVSEVKQYSRLVQTAHFRMDVALFHRCIVMFDRVIWPGEIDLFDTNTAREWQGKDCTV